MAPAHAAVKPTTPPGTMVTNGLAGAIKHNIVPMIDRVAGNMTPVGADVVDQPVADREGRREGL